MHNENKTGNWAVGILEYTRKKKAVDPFPEGKALMATFREWAKQFRYQKGRAELEAALQTDSGNIS